GCGTCVELCPEIFAFNDDTNKAYVILPEGGDEGCIDDAAASCPVSCITNE
ncbi:MAG: ferredoxin, partial [Desulfobulbus sp.]|nr:ferredoxin [Desulfobulbus sp.]